MINRKVPVILLVLLFGITLSLASAAPEEIRIGMVLVERGTFTMGNTSESDDHDDKPAHTVTFTYDFCIGRYEVTFEEYDLFCDDTGRARPDDRGWGRGTRPVINVNWWDAAAYCNWLSDKEGLPQAYDSLGNFLDSSGEPTLNPSLVKGYRLATEAEWEFAASGGNKSLGYRRAGSDNVNRIAWYKSNSENMTHEVGTKEPNELGLYDMSGNVWEWVSDRFALYSAEAKIDPYNGSEGSRRVSRGGSWINCTLGVRVFYRNNSLPSYATVNLGFRIAITMSE